MKPNFGITPTPTNRLDNNDSLIKSRNPWFHTKVLSRTLGLGLVLLGNVVVQLPHAPVLAATACTSMSRGSEGDDVRALQKTLNDNGFDVGIIDGIFGGLTESELKRFQRRNDLDPDGEVGPATCNALIRLDQTEFVAATSSPSSQVVSGSASSSNDTLKPGDQGEQVRILQSALRSVRYSSLPLTGVYDKQTEDTVKAFQFSEKLPATGEADPVTRNRLGSYLNSDNGSTNPTPQPTPDTPDIVYTPPVANNNDNNDAGLDYQVVVPVRGNDSLLAGVNGATLNRTRLGTFVNAGSYAHRYQAESVSYALKARGFDARVVHK